MAHNIYLKYNSCDFLKVFLMFSLLDRCVMVSQHKYHPPPPTLPLPSVASYLPSNLLERHIFLNIFFFLAFTCQRYVWHNVIPLTMTVLITHSII